MELSTFVVFLKIRLFLFFVCIRYNNHMHFEFRIHSKTMVNSSMAMLLMALLVSAVESTCSVTYRLYDKDLESYYVNLYGDDNVSYPPCNINIEAVVSCRNKFDGVVRLQLRDSDGNLVKVKTEKVAPYFLFGDFKGKIRSAQLLGEYSIESMLDDKETEPIRFTLYPCVPSSL